MQDFLIVKHQDLIPVFDLQNECIIHTNLLVVGKSRRRLPGAEIQELGSRFLGLDNRPLQKFKPHYAHITDLTSKDAPDRVS